MNLFIRQALAPNDQEVISLISGLSNKDLVSFLDSAPQFTSFYQELKHWAQTSTKVEFDFNADFTPQFSAGVTEAFNNFYLKYSDKNLHILKGEYPYHRDVWTSLGKQFNWYKDGALTTNSMLIISSPFSATGNYEDNIHHILKECEQKNVPVMLDCAFLGLGENISLRQFMHYKCIRQYSFSLSKMFNIGKFRVAINWTREPSGPLAVLNQWNYLNWPGIFFARNLLANFNFDYMAKKYKPLQEKICTEYQLQPSNSYFFGIGDENYQEFSRDGSVNRVCITPAFNS